MSTVDERLTIMHSVCHEKNPPDCIHADEQAKLALEFFTSREINKLVNLYDAQILAIPQDLSEELIVETMQHIFKFSVSTAFAIGYSLAKEELKVPTYET